MSVWGPDIFLQDEMGSVHTIVQTPHTVHEETQRITTYADTGRDSLSTSFASTETVSLNHKDVMSEELYPYTNPTSSLEEGLQNTSRAQIRGTDMPVYGKSCSCPQVIKSSVDVTTDNTFTGHPCSSQHSNSYLQFVHERWSATPVNVTISDDEMVVDPEMDDSL